MSYCCTVVLYCCLCFQEVSFVCSSAKWKLHDQQQQHAEATCLFTTAVKSFLFGSIVPDTALVNDSLYSAQQRIKIYYLSQIQITIIEETLWKQNPLFSKFLYILIRVLLHRSCFSMFAVFLLAEPFTQIKMPLEEIWTGWPLSSASH